MTPDQKIMKRYINSVKRRLNLPGDVKDRVMNDFNSSISARMEAGESDRQIRAELGTPKEAAAVLNEQMKEYAFRKSPWRWAAFAGAMLSGLVLVWMTAVNWLLNLLFGQTFGEQQSVGIIGGADGPSAILVTTAPGVDMDIVILLVLLVVFLGGFWYLSHLKKK